MPGRTVRKTITRAKAGRVERVADTLVVEAPVTIFADGAEIVTLLCTPDDIEALTVGFLFGEGILRSASALKEIRLDRRGGVVNVSLEGGLPPEATAMEGRALTTGCGRGVMFYTIQDRDGLKRRRRRKKFPASAIPGLFKELHERSGLFAVTGASHAAALADEGGLRFMGEDVGRHNAVDKAIGRALLEKAAPEDMILISTGRISSEILAKSARAGIPVVASRSAPTSLAARFADKLGITLVGFARGDRMNVYTGQDGLSWE